jgi:hypothetical protein
MTSMNTIRSVPFEVMLLITGFSVLVGLGRWYVWSGKSTPLSKTFRRLTLGGLLSMFLVVAAFWGFLYLRLRQP